MCACSFLIGKIVLIFPCPGRSWKSGKTNRSFIISPKQLHFSILKWLTPFWGSQCALVPMVCTVWGLGGSSLPTVGQMEAPVSHEPEARPLQIPFHDSLRVLSWICMKIKFISSATALIRNLRLLLFLWVVVKVMADGNVLGSVCQYPSLFFSQQCTVKEKHSYPHRGRPSVFSFW